MDIQPELKMDIPTGTAAANDSGLETSNDSNDTALVFPVGFNQSSLVQFTSRHDLLLFGGNTASDSIAVASGSGKQDRSMSVPSTSNIQQSSVYRLATETKELPTGILGSSRFYKMKYKTPGSLHKHSIPYIRTQSNERKLRLAASLSNIEVVLRLLEAGVNPNSSDDYQRSALHLASSRGYTDVVAQLLKYGAKPNQKDSLGNTPLHLAVCSASSFNFNMVVRILLKYGASVHCTDRNGKNPLDLVKSKLSLMRMRREKDQTPETAKMLLELSILTSLLIHTYVKEEKSLDMNSLEERLQKLSTNEIDNEADILLAKVEQLTLKN